MSNDELIVGAEAVIKALVENGVEVIFGYPGGAVLPLYDAIFQNTSLKHILKRTLSTNTKQLDRWRNMQHHFLELVVPTLIISYIMVETHSLNNIQMTMPVLV